MAATVRPRRSVLYMPGSNPRALDKASALPADGLILDLEDAVAPDAKAAARDAGPRRAAGRRLRRRARRSSGSTAWRRPGATPTSSPRRRAGADAVLIPKVESAAMRPPGARRPRPGRRAAGSAALVHDGDPARDAARGRDRGREPAGRRAGDGHLRPRQGAARGAHPAPPAAAHRARPLPAWPRAPAVSRSSMASSSTSGRGGLRGRLPAGRRARLRRQDPDPSRGRSSPPTGCSRRAATRLRARDGSSPRTSEALRQGKGVVVVDGRLVENLHVAEARREVELAAAIAALAG